MEFLDFLLGGFGPGFFVEDSFCFRYLSAKNKSLGS